MTTVQDERHRSASGRILLGDVMLAVVSLLLVAGCVTYLIAGEIDVRKKVRTVTASVYQVSVKWGIVRSGPGASYKRIRSVWRTQPILRIGENGNWYRVQLHDGTTGWIHRGSVRFARDLGVQVYVDRLRRTAITETFQEMATTIPYTSFVELESRDVQQNAWESLFQSYLRAGRVASIE